LKVVVYFEGQESSLQEKGVSFNYLNKAYFYSGTKGDILAAKSQRLIVKIIVTFIATADRGFNRYRLF
jgi:hypothetical protein